MADHPPAGAAADDALPRERTLHELVPLSPPDDEEDFQVDWEAVVARVISHPKEASLPYVEGQIHDSPTVLHVMMAYGPPYEAVSAILKAFPVAVHIRVQRPSERERWTPLQAALKLGGAPPASIVRILLGAAAANYSPHEREERTLHELVPLRGAERVDWDMVVQRCQTHPEEAWKRYGETAPENSLKPFEDELTRLNPADSPTILHVMMKVYEPSLEAVQEVLWAHQRARREAVCVQAYDPSEKKYFTPLEAALNRKHIVRNMLITRALNITRNMLEAYFRERQLRGSPFEFRSGSFDQFGEYNIPWWYIYGDRDKEKVRALLELAPHHSQVSCKLVVGEAIRKYFGSDRGEWTDQKKQETWDIMQLVLGFMTHNTVEQPVLDSRPRCYVHRILEARYHVDNSRLINVLQETRSRDPSQFSARDSSRKLPLHLLLSEDLDQPSRSRFFERCLRSRVDHAGLIKAVLSGFPGAAKTPDPLTGDLPLHAALKFGLPFDDVLEADRRAIRTRSTEDRLYPFEVAMLRLSREVAKFGLPIDDVLEADRRAIRTRNTEDPLYPIEVAMLRLSRANAMLRLSREKLWGLQRITPDGEIASLNAAYVTLREEPSLLQVRRAPLNVASAAGSCGDPEAKRRRQA